ncbi:O-antigen ligase [Catalinimonas alkaloidigena]|uniref:O-antigen ligase n=1 Tax=Catalinimonas alkaloidigena TaxID=1075417 RepID=A0A1G8WGV5_9BACT|nr:O-antigen ligase family protein [Catalinimonas alkaloidigena]SDJ77512.1 O-antigen ligase [Catalinimonas alkaloidigena]
MLKIGRPVPQGSVSPPVQLLLFYTFGLLTLGSLGVALRFEQPAFALLPVALLSVAFVLFDTRLIYLTYLVTIVCSIQLEIGSFTTDAPVEPLMVVLMGVVIASFLLYRDYDSAFIRHPYVVLLLFYLAILPLNLAFSVDTFLSIKYYLAKLWYIAAGVFATGYFIRNFRDIRQWFWLLFVPLFLWAGWIVVKHALEKFSFEAANLIARPLFYNHVIWSTFLALFIPVTFFARTWYPKGSWQRRLIGAGVLLFLLTIILSYTRASWLAVVTMALFYWVVRWRLTQLAMVGLTFATIAGLGFMISSNRYLDYAPEYERTIFHQGDLAKHLEATYSLEDVSGMERVYRWVAGVRMFQERPILGFGPNTFYPDYKRFVVNRFRTYVSDNPEHSTTHNYFLMLLCEQGIVGFTFFSALCIVVLLRTTRVYHQLTSPNLKAALMGCILGFVSILFHLLLNDLIETNNIGSMFYIFIALMIRIELMGRRSASPVS